MARKNNISDLFNPNGCLNQSTIVKFIDKRLDEKDLQKVLSHLDACPLCKDAVEGISGVGANQFSEDMNKLRADFYAISSDKDKKHRLRLIGFISAAASIIIILGVLFFYHRTRLNTESNIAQSVETIEEVKEEALPGEEFVPLNETANPVQLKKEKTPEVKSVSMNIQPLSDTDEEQVSVSEAAREDLFVHAEIPDDEKDVEPAATEMPMEPSEQYSVITDIPLTTATADKRRSESAINAGLHQEKAAPEARTALPAKHVLFISDERPTFKGGDISEFVNYLQDQLKTSDQILKKMEADSIIISFLVDTLGRPVNIRIINQTDPEIYKEIVRYFSSSPDWIPGKENGIRVNVGYTISLRIHPENRK